MTKKTRTLALFLITLSLILIPNFVSGLPSYEDEYRFITIYETWDKIEGYEKMSEYQEYQYTYEILDYENGILYFNLIYQREFSVNSINLTYTLEPDPWIRPIGSFFLLNDQFDYYSNKWETDENVYTVLGSSNVGSNFSKDIRTYSDYTFNGEFAGLWSNKIVRYTYNETLQEFESINDTVEFESTVFIQYDTNGVLENLEIELNMVGSIYEGYYFRSKKRVQSFNQISFSSLLVLSVMIISLAVVNNYIRKTKRK